MDIPTDFAADGSPLPADPSPRARRAHHRVAPLIGGGAVVAAALRLTAEFGEDAATAAALRAAHARAQDNPYSYCRWKEVERAIGWMAMPAGTDTRH